MNLYIELLRNGDSIQAHFDRFESENGAYKVYKDKYILLDFELRKNRPTRLPKGCEEYSKKYFCFVLSTNSLYCGDKCVRKNVSNKLKSSGY